MFLDNVPDLNTADPTVANYDNLVSGGIFEITVTPNAIAPWETQTTSLLSLNTTFNEIIIDVNGWTGPTFNGQNLDFVQLFFFTPLVDDTLLGLVDVNYNPPTDFGNIFIGFDGGLLLASPLTAFSATAVPEPSALFLLGTGLVGLAAWRSRKRTA